MNKNKVLSTIIAGSFLTMSLQPAFADEYMVLPPLDDTGYTQDRPLPSPQIQSEPQTPTAPTSNYSNNTYNNYNTNYTSSPQPAYQDSGNQNAVDYATTPLQGTISTVPVGTAFQVILNDSINSMRYHVGDIFTATLNQPIAVDGNIIVDAGSEVVGQVTYTDDAGRAGRHAKMEVKFTRIKPLYGNIIPITGKVLTEDNTGVLKGGTVKKQLVQSVKTEALAAGGGTIIGAGIGAMAGNAGTGAVIGATGGAGIGLAWLLWRKGKEVKISSGTKMVVVLEQPFNVVK